MRRVRSALGFSRPWAAQMPHMVAAGTAAAMASGRNAPVAELPVGDLQARLLADGAYLGRAHEGTRAAA